jgi:hypothetical protein
MINCVFKSLKLIWILSSLIRKKKIKIREGICNWQILFRHLKVFAKHSHSFPIQRAPEGLLAIVMLQKQFMREIYE